MKKKQFTKSCHAITYPRIQHSAIIVNSIENRRSTVIIGKLCSTWTQHTADCLWWMSEHNTCLWCLWDWWSCGAQTTLNNGMSQLILFACLQIQQTDVEQDKSPIQTLCLYAVETWILLTANWGMVEEVFITDWHSLSYCRHFVACWPQSTHGPNNLPSVILA